MTTKNTKRRKANQDVKSDYVYDQNTGQYVPKTMSPELYKQTQKDTARRAIVTGGVGLLGEAAQIGIGLGAMNDPALQSMRDEKARLEARIAKGPDLRTEKEKRDYIDSATAGAQRAVDASRAQTQKTLASVGKFDAGSLLTSMTQKIPGIQKASLEAKRDLAAEEVARQQLKEEQDIRDRRTIGSIEQTEMNLRNKFVREPLAQGLGNLGKYLGTVAAYAPAKSIDDEVARLREAEVPEEEIAEFAKTYRRKPRKGRKAADEMLSRMSGDTKPKVEEKSETAEPQPVMSWSDTATSGKFSDVEYRLEKEGGNIRYNSPTTNREIVVRPNTEAYESIMEIRPEPRPPQTLDEQIDDSVKQKETQRIVASYEEYKNASFNEAYEGMPKYKKGSNIYVYDDANKSWIKTNLLGNNPSEPQSIERIKNADPSLIQGELYRLGIAEGLYE